MKFTNTLSGKKEPFIVNGPVSLYVCGITPYDHSHVGHGRCYVTYDVLCRLFSFVGIAVNYCRNFTDIDDKLLNKAEKECGDRLRYREIADRYIASFHDDMFALNCLSPQDEPRVTDNMHLIIEFIEKLIACGHAYQANGDVYFDIATFAEYGKLSKQKIEDLRAGVRMDVREDKKNSLDFALWKSEPNGEFWNSPWGWGRPGWHIECSALAGAHVDIHGGGLDLVFPHHENEIAQSESLYGAPFARLWMHNGFVMSNKEKMSKSLGNFFILHELFEHFDPMVVRYFFITHHYRAPIDFSFELLAQAQKSYERIIRIFEKSSSNCDVTSYQSAIVDRMVDFLKDDLNTPGLLGVFFENITAIAENEYELAAVKNIFVTVLGLTLKPLAEKKVVVTAEIQALIDERKRARQEKDWKRSDELRNKLVELGIDVHDNKV